MTQIDMQLQRQDWNDYRGEDGDSSTMSKEEFREYAKAQFPQLTDDEIDAIFEEADESSRGQRNGGDGVLSKSEFDVATTLLMDKEVDVSQDVEARRPSSQDSSPSRRENEGSGRRTSNEDAGRDDRPVRENNARDDRPVRENNARDDRPVREEGRTRNEDIGGNNRSRGESRDNGGRRPERTPQEQADYDAEMRKYGPSGSATGTSGSDSSSPYESVDYSSVGEANSGGGGEAKSPRDFDKPPEPPRSESRSEPREESRRSSPRRPENNTGRDSSRQKDPEGEPVKGFVELGSGERIMPNQSLADEDRVYINDKVYDRQDDGSFKSADGDTKLLSVNDRGQLIESPDPMAVRTVSADDAINNDTGEQIESDAELQAANAVQVGNSRYIRNDDGTFSPASGEGADVTMSMDDESGEITVTPLAAKPEPGAPEKGTPIKGNLTLQNGKKPTSDAELQGADKVIIDEVAYIKNDSGAFVGADGNSFLLSMDENGVIRKSADNGGEATGKKGETMNMDTNTPISSREELQNSSTIKLNGEVFNKNDDNTFSPASDPDKKVSLTLEGNQVKSTPMGSDTGPITEAGWKDWATSENGGKLTEDQADKIWADHNFKGNTTASGIADANHRAQLFAKVETAGEHINEENWKAWATTPKSEGGMGLTPAQADKVWTDVSRDGNTAEEGSVDANIRHKLYAAAAKISTPNTEIDTGTTDTPIKGMTGDPMNLNDPSQTHTVIGEDGSIKPAEGHESSWMVQNGGNTFMADGNGTFTVAHQDGSVTTGASLNLDSTGNISVSGGEKRAAPEDGKAIVLDQNKQPTGRPLDDTVPAGSTFTQIANGKITTATRTAEGWEGKTVDQATGTEGRFYGATSLSRDGAGGMLVPDDGKGSGDRSKEYWKAHDQAVSAGMKSWHEYESMGDFHTERAHQKGHHDEGHIKLSQSAEDWLKKNSSHEQNDNTAFRNQDVISGLESGSLIQQPDGTITRPQ